MTKDAFSTVPYDQEEADTIAAFEKALDEGTFTNDLTPERKAKAEASAQATIRANKTRITTMLGTNDLSRLKVKASELGMPYQTLLSSVVHQYVEGTLVPRQH